MKYYIASAMSGVTEGDETFDTAEEAIATRDQWEMEDVADGLEPGYWTVIDEKGNKIA